MVSKSKTVQEPKTKNQKGKKPAAMTARLRTTEKKPASDKKPAVKKATQPKRRALYLALSEDRQDELYQRHGGNHPLSLTNQISRSLRLKQTPSYDAAFTLHAREHGVTHAEWGILKSLIGAVLNRRKRFPVTLKKREAFYDFTGSVIRMKDDETREPRYRVQEKFGPVIYFVCDRENQPICCGTERNPSNHMIRAAAMYAHDHWIAQSKEKPIGGPSNEELYQEHLASINRCWAPGEAPTEEELNR
jgi:hypothetical protein